MSGHGIAQIVSASDHGVAVCAASARISTREGTALEILDRSHGDEKDVNLIGKVLASGHRTPLEHHVFSVAFENVSVRTEQFVIEHRLGSYTVKSRRYVDFANAGFYVPSDLAAPLSGLYSESVRRLFDIYSRLTCLGIPREDARFVLPYCFYSNFYATMNARELVHLTSAMLFGRGRFNAELVHLGEQLKSQIESIYPGVVDAEKELYRDAEPIPDACSEICAPHEVHGSAALLFEPADAKGILESAFPSATIDRDFLFRLVHSDRPRALELLNYVFRIENISLACVTHFARHRMQSSLFPPVQNALRGGGYIVPDTVRSNEEAYELYLEAFTGHYQSVAICIDAGIPDDDLGYLALAGNTVSYPMAVNGRELMHFMRLRACNRAQWEIRSVAAQMLQELRGRFPDLFCYFGPSCAMTGRCPEGRLTCGKPYPYIS